MPVAQPKQRVLFLCTGNSCRSQMAEGWARHLKHDEFAAASAGIHSSEINPLAVRVMAEVGVDISSQLSEPVSNYLDHDFDFVVTVCGHANKTCPAFPASAKIIHHGFDDPPALTADLSDPEEILRVYRRVRDEIKGFIELLPEYFREF